MTNHTMKIPEAARLLGVTDRTVRNYIKKGLLSRQRKSRTPLLDPVEVEELRLDLQSTSPVLSRRAFIQLRSKVRRLESHMEVVLRVLDTKSQPLGLSSPYAKDLYGLALEHLKKSSWEVAEIKPWVEIFERVDEGDFETTAIATEDPKAWLVFLRLNVGMTAHIVKDPSYASSIDLQTLHRMLSEGRRRMRISAFIYAEMTSRVEEDLARYGFAEAPKSSVDTLFSEVLKK